MTQGIDSSFAMSGLVQQSELAQNLQVASAKEPARSAEQEKIREAALQFEQIMVRQLLQPLEKSLSKSMGGEGSSSPMIGGMLLNSLSESVTNGGGLGLASVIEEALRDVSVQPVSAAETSKVQPGQHRG